MTQKIRIWKISEKNKLDEVEMSKLNMETRLEDWLHKDISMVSDDFLTIGRQVKTDFGKYIDLLCIDERGDLVIIELKKDKTPRDVVAQCLDYASWVKGLSRERIIEIANDHFGVENVLEEEFGKKFKEELPEILNEEHKMVIVATELDDSTERIVKYLTEQHGVDINIVTFSHYRKDNKEFLARAFLIEPGSNIRRDTKRRPALSNEQLQQIAEEKGVGLIHKKLTDELQHYFDRRTTTLSTVSFLGHIGDQTQTILNLEPGDSEQKKGLFYKVYIDRAAKYFSLSKGNIDSLFPGLKEKSPAWSGGPDVYRGYFKNADKFIESLEKIKKIK